MAEEPKLSPLELAQQVLADDAEHTGKHGIVWSDADFAARMREGAVELARTVLYLLTEQRDRLAHAEVEVERLRKRLREAAIAYAASDDPDTTKRAGDELEVVASVFAHAEAEQFTALEDAGFGYCATCDAVTPLADLHLYYEDLDGICPACLSEAEQEQEERAVRRAARKRRRKLS